jgi:hypothetical protein
MTAKVGHQKNQIMQQSCMTHPTKIYGFSGFLFSLLLRIIHYYNNRIYWLILLREHFPYTYNYLSILLDSELIYQFDYRVTNTYFRIRLYLFCALMFTARYVCIIYRLRKHYKTWAIIS